MAEAFRSALPPPPPPMAVRKAHVASAGVLSATFGIPGQSNIPSDEGNHKVVIAVLDLEAELEWVCVPREKESVFLTVRLFLRWKLSCTLIYSFSVHGREL